MSTLARDLIRQEYGESRNFITPHRLGYGMLASYWCQGFLVYALAYELSKGTGFPRKFGERGPELWALTVVRVRSWRRYEKPVRAFALSKCFQSRAEMCKYRNTLRRAARLAVRGIAKSA